MPTRTVTPPTQEPVSLAEAKSHLRLEESRDDVYVQALIVAARQYIEKVCWRGLLFQKLELTLPGFRGADKLELPKTYGPGGGDGLSGISAFGAYGSAAQFQGTRFQPFIELTGGHLATTPGVVISYLDENGVSQTLSPLAYVVEGQDNEEMCARVWLNTNGGYSWPNVLDRFDAVKIVYNIGWATRDLVPGPLKNSILLLVSQMYEYRTPQVTGTIATMLEFTINALTSPYRFVRL